MTMDESALVCLGLALVLAVYACAAALGGHYRRLPELRWSAERAALATAALVTYAVVVLAGLLLNHQFAVAFVADVSNRAMSARAILSAFWGGQPGSLLFRTWVLTLFGVAVVVVQRRRERTLLPLMVAVLALVEAFFLLVLLVSANPFARLAVAPADGRGLNPLLQDEAMSFHPPLLLSGYMAFTLPFAVAVAGLLSGQVGIGWLRALRRWTLCAWMIQGCGLLAGAWWAYHVLGWGGYWGWDPVENVALLPWLVATALLHSLMVQERRGMLRVWNVALTAGAYCLAVFGMFVVGSGVLTSVHAFAASAVGPLFFSFLAVLLLGLVALVAFRLPLLQSRGQFDALLSRESAFLLNNLLLVGVVVATFWGTIFPMVSEVVRGAKIGLGASFFAKVNAPILLLLLVLMGVAPLLGWRRTSSPALRRALIVPLATAGVLWAALVFLGMRNGLGAFAFAVCAFAVVATGVEYRRGIRARRKGGESLPRALLMLVARDRRRYVGYVVHMAVLLLALGVIGSTFQTAREVRLRPGQSALVGPYTLRLAGYRPLAAPGMQGLLADVQVSRGGRPLGEVRPERRVYANWEKQPVTGVAIMTTRPWLDDVYVLQTGRDDDDTGTFRVFVNPLVCLLWLGGALFLLSVGALAWPRRPQRPVFRPISTGKAIPSEA